MPKSTGKQQYGNDSISALKGADRVRKRPGVIFGSDGLEGCEHAVFEILSNAIDEAREGHGDTITITRYEDKSIEVEDFGRGCPVDWNEKEQKFNWELVFCELYAGGKYNNLEGDNYEYSLGLNGLGTCATQYASEYFDALIHRDGFEYSLHFEKGENIGGLQKAPWSGKKTGSRFRWKPDLDVFTDINIPVEFFLDVLKRQAVVNAGVTFRFRNQVNGKFETTDFQYQNGIVDYVRELSGENALTTPVFWQTERRGRDRADKPDYKVKLSVSFCFSNTVNIIEHYHNSSWLEHGGSPEKARLNIKKKLSGNVDISNRVQKFVDCRTKDTERRELYIVEGDSALGSVKLSRDAEFQGIMPVRGKILNCLKADFGKIFKSEIITDLLKVLGCGVEVHDKRAKDMADFDLMNLRWNKVVICTDADVDGYQIRTLILTMLYRLTPTLIQRGYVYIAESPLYEINYKEKTWFAYNETEKTNILDELGDRKYTIQRSKGLGENEPDMMWLTTMNPATRRLIKVMPEDVERTAQVFDLLLGDNLSGRKDHIAENGYKYLELADIS